jgi:tetratricopeptide (TPR) repeat protein
MAIASKREWNPISMELSMRLGRAKRLLPASILAAVLLPGAAALGQTLQDHRWCEGESGATVAQRLDGCSAVIKGGREKGDKLAEIFNHRGVAYRLKGDHDRAIADYAQAIRLNPKFGAAFNNRGVAYDYKGDFDRAIADFDQAIKLKPSAEAHFNRGNAYLGKSQYASAIDDYNQAIKLKTDFAAAFDNRCWARAVVGILKQALADCNEALRLMPGNASTHDSRGFIFLKMTNFDAAVSDYDAALQVDPKLAFALYGRGLARLRNEDPAGEADITAAKALQADIAEEYARYGIPETR